MIYQVVLVKFNLSVTFFYLQALSAQCEGGPVPLVLETGEVIPPANLTHVPSCSYFNPRQLPPPRTPHLIKSISNQGPFIFTPIHFGSLERKNKKDEGKMGMSFSISITILITYLTSLRLLLN